MTTRTYYRNSTLAFPRTAEYASAVERPTNRPSIKAWLFVYVAAIIVVIYSVAYVSAP